MSNNSASATLYIKGGRCVLDILVFMIRGRVPPLSEIHQSYCREYPDRHYDQLSSDGISLDTGKTLLLARTLSGPGGLIIDLKGARLIKVS